MGRLLAALRDYDRRRPGLPGEHLFTATAGAALLRAAPRRRSGLGKALAFAAGAALLWRAASGRDGIRRLVR
jgi:uncharacterized membrane protein